MYSAKPRMGSIKDDDNHSSSSSSSDEFFSTTMALRPPSGKAVRQSSSPPPRSPPPPPPPTATAAAAATSSTTGGEVRGLSRARDAGADAHTSAVAPTQASPNTRRAETTLNSDASTSSLDSNNRAAVRAAEDAFFASSSEDSDAGKGGGGRPSSSEASDPWAPPPRCRTMAMTTGARRLGAPTADPEPLTPAGSQPPPPLRPVTGAGLPPPSHSGHHRTNMDYLSPRSCPPLSALGQSSTRTAGEASPDTTSSPETYHRPATAGRNHAQTTSAPHRRSHEANQTRSGLGAGRHHHRHPTGCPSGSGSLAASRQVSDEDKDEPASVPGRGAGHRTRRRSPHAASGTGSRAGVGVSTGTAVPVHELSDDDYVYRFRLVEVLSRLAFELLRVRPANHVAFTRAWLWGEIRASPSRGARAGAGADPASAAAAFLLPVMKPTTYAASLRTGATTTTVDSPLPVAVTAGRVPDVSGDVSVPTRAPGAATVTASAVAMGETERRPAGEGVMAAGEDSRNAHAITPAAAAAATAATAATAALTGVQDVRSDATTVADEVEERGVEGCEHNPTGNVAVMKSFGKPPSPPKGGGEAAGGGGGHITVDLADVSVATMLTSGLADAMAGILAGRRPRREARAAATEAFVTVPDLQETAGRASRPCTPRSLATALESTRAPTAHELLTRESTQASPPPQQPQQQQEQQQEGEAEAVPNQGPHTDAATHTATAAATGCPGNPGRLRSGGADVENDDDDDGVGFVTFDPVITVDAGTRGRPATAEGGAYPRPSGHGYGGTAALSTGPAAVGSTTGGGTAAKPGVRGKDSVIPSALLAAVAPNSMANAHAARVRREAAAVAKSGAAAQGSAGAVGFGPTGAAAGGPGVGSTTVLGDGVGGTAPSTTRTTTLSVGLGYPVAAGSRLNLHALAGSAAGGGPTMGASPPTVGPPSLWGLRSSATTSANLLLPPTNNNTTTTTSAAPSAGLAGPTTTTTTTSIPSTPALGVSPASRASSAVVDGLAEAAPEAVGVPSLGGDGASADYPLAAFPTLCTGGSGNSGGGGGGIGGVTGRGGVGSSVHGAARPLREEGSRSGSGGSAPAAAAAAAATASATAATTTVTATATAPGLAVTPGTGAERPSLVTTMQSEALKHMYALIGQVPPARYAAALVFLEGLTVSPQAAEDEDSNGMGTASQSSGGGGFMDPTGFGASGNARAAMAARVAGVTGGGLDGHGRGSTSVLGSAAAITTASTSAAAASNPRRESPRSLETGGHATSGMDGGGGVGSPLSAADAGPSASVEAIVKDALSQSIIMKLPADHRKTKHMATASTTTAPAASPVAAGAGAAESASLGASPAVPPDPSLAMAAAEAASIGGYMQSSKAARAVAAGLGKLDAAASTSLVSFHRRPATPSITTATAAHGRAFPAADAKEPFFSHGATAAGSQAAREAVSLMGNPSPTVSAPHSPRDGGGGGRPGSYPRGAVDEGAAGVGEEVRGVGTAAGPRGIGAAPSKAEEGPTTGGEAAALAATAVGEELLTVAPPNPPSLSEVPPASVCDHAVVASSMAGELAGGLVRGGAGVEAGNAQQELEQQEQQQQEESPHLPVEGRPLQPVRVHDEGAGPRPRAPSPLAGPAKAQSAPTLPLHVPGSEPACEGEPNEPTPRPAPPHHELPMPVMTAAKGADDGVHPRPGSRPTTVPALMVPSQVPRLTSPPLCPPEPLGAPSRLQRLPSTPASTPGSGTVSPRCSPTTRGVPPGVGGEVGLGFSAIGLLASASTSSADMILPYAMGAQPTGADPYTMGTLGGLADSDSAGQRSPSSAPSMRPPDTNLTTSAVASAGVAAAGLGAPPPYERDTSPPHVGSPYTVDGALERLRRAHTEEDLRGAPLPGLTHGSFLSGPRSGSAPLPASLPDSSTSSTTAFSPELLSSVAYRAHFTGGPLPRPHRAAAAGAMGLLRTATVPTFGHVSTEAAPTVASSAPTEGDSVGVEGERGGGVGVARGSGGAGSSAEHESAPPHGRSPGQHPHHLLSSGGGGAGGGSRLSSSTFARHSATTSGLPSVSGPGPSLASAGGRLLVPLLDSARASGPVWGGGGSPGQASTGAASRHSSAVGSAAPGQEAYSLAAAMSTFLSQEGSLPTGELDAVRGSIAANRLFAALDDTQVETLLRAMVRAGHQRDDVLAREGSPSMECLLLVVAGSVTVTRKGTVTRTLGKGQFFGEMELSYPATVSQVTLTVTSDTAITYSLTRESYERLVLFESDARRTMFLQYLDRIPLLRGVPAADRARLAEGLRVCRMKEGATLTVQGAPVEWLYLVMSGEVQQSFTRATLRACNTRLAAEAAAATAARTPMVSRSGPAYGAGSLSSLDSRVGLVHGSEGAEGGTTRSPAVAPRPARGGNGEPVDDGCSGSVLHSPKSPPPSLSARTPTMGLGGLSAPLLHPHSPEACSLREGTASSGGSGSQREETPQIICTRRVGELVGEVEFVFRCNGLLTAVAHAGPVQVARISRLHFEVVMGRPALGSLRAFLVTDAAYRFFERVAPEDVKAEMRRVGLTRAVAETQPHHRHESQTNLASMHRGSVDAVEGGATGGQLDGKRRSSRRLTKRMSSHRSCAAMAYAGEEGRPADARLVYALSPSLSGSATRRDRRSRTSRASTPKDPFGAMPGSPTAAGPTPANGSLSGPALQPASFSSVWGTTGGRQGSLLGVGGVRGGPRMSRHGTANSLVQLPGAGPTTSSASAHPQSPAVWGAQGSSSATGRSRDRAPSYRSGHGGIGGGRRHAGQTQSSVEGSGRWHHISADGEIIFSGSRNLYRFPAQALRTNNSILIAVVVDGTIIRWNPTAQRVVGYAPFEVVGQSIYTLMAGEESRKLLKVKLQAAKTYAGNWDAYTTAEMDRQEVFSFRQSSGFSQIGIALSVIPSIFAASNEVFLLIGREAKYRAAANYAADVARWLNNTLKPQLQHFHRTVSAIESNGWQVTMEDALRLRGNLDACTSMVDQFARFSNMNMETVSESWRPVRLPDVLRRFLFEANTLARPRNHTFFCNLEEVTPRYEIFLDAPQVFQVLLMLVQDAIRITDYDAEVEVNIELRVTIVEPDEPHQPPQDARSVASPASNRHGNPRTGGRTTAGVASPGPAAASPTQYFSPLHVVPNTLMDGAEDTAGESPVAVTSMTDGTTASGAGEVGEAATAGVGEFASPTEPAAPSTTPPAAAAAATTTTTTRQTIDISATSLRRVRFEMRDNGPSIESLRSPDFQDWYDDYDIQHAEQKRRRQGGAGAAPLGASESVPPATSPPARGPAGGSPVTSGAPSSPFPMTAAPSADSVAALATQGGPGLIAAAAAAAAVPPPPRPPRGGDLPRVSKAVEAMGGFLYGFTRPEVDGNMVRIELPLLAVPGGKEGEEGAGVGGEGGEGVLAGAVSDPVLPAGRSLTVMVADSDRAHQSLMCNLLWARQHAVVPVTSFREVMRKVEANAADILIIDPLQLDITAADYDTLHSDNPFDDIRDASSRMVLVVMGTDFSDWRVQKLLDRNSVIELPKLGSTVLVHIAMQEAELMVTEMREEEERIELLRRTFTCSVAGRHKVGRLLGKGTFGDVYEVEDTLTGGKMAMKRMQLHDGVFADEVVEEILAMTRLQHENIIHYFYCEKESDTLLRLYMEFAPGGTLRNRIRQNPGMALPFDQIVQHLTDICRGLAYVHAQHYVHGDLKTANLLLGTRGRTKIGDFGTAKRVRAGQQLYTMVGTPQYMAPEVLNADAEQRIGYDFKADIWSVGCIALEMATGQPPFAHLEQTHGMGIIKYLSELTDTPDLSPLFSGNPLVFEFVKGCLDLDPHNRPSAQELFHFDILQGAVTSIRAERIVKRAEMLYKLNKYAAMRADPDDPRGFDITGSEEDEEDDVMDEEDLEEEEEEEDTVTDSEGMAFDSPDSPSAALGRRVVRHHAAEDSASGSVSESLSDTGIESSRASR